MANIHGHPHSKLGPTGRCASDGRQILRATQRKDRKLALAVAVISERAERLRTTSARNCFIEWLRRREVKRSEVTAGRFKGVINTFLSELANSGSHPEIRRKLTGHKTASVHDLYTHFERETLRAAVHAIPSPPEL